MSENANLNDTNSGLELNTTSPDTPRIVKEGDNGEENNSALEDGISDNDSNFTSASTEPEPSLSGDDEESTISTDTSLVRSSGPETGNEQEKDPNNDKCESRLDQEEVEVNVKENGRKTYKEVLAENEELRQMVDSKNLRLSELEKNYEVIKDENNLISLELQNVQKEANDQKVKLEWEILKNVKENQCLESRVQKLRTGIKELNEMMFEALLQLNSNGKNRAITEAQSSSSLNSNALALVPMSLKSTVSLPNNVELGKVLRNKERDNNGTGNSTEDDSSTDTFTGSTERVTPIAEQIHRCLESIPASTSHMKVNNKSNVKFTEESKNGNNNVTSRQPPRRKILKKKRLIHAVDNKRQSEGFYCVCGTCLTTKLGLFSHIKYHTCVGQFRCTVKECRRRYFTTTSLKNHMKAQHGLVYRGRDGCRKCGHTFLTRKQLYLHCKSVHNCGPLARACKKRKKESTSSTMLSNVIFKSSPSSFPSSSPENFSEIGNSSMETGNAVVLSSGKGRCETSNQNADPFQIRHELDTSKPSYNRVHCVCGRNFTSERYLRLHVNHFLYEPRFACKVCGKLYNDMGHLKQHMHLKHGMPFEGGSGCRTCGIIFKTRMAFNQHCKKEHNKAEFENCHQKIIGSSLPTNTSTQHNEQTVHEKRQRKIPVRYQKEFRTVSVGLCQNKSIPKISKYDRTNQHRADPDYADGIKCTCGTAFSSRSALLNHCISFSETPLQHGVDRINENSKIFKCLCGLYFVAQRTLREHIQLKLGLTPFPCKICKETFLRHDYLRTHLQRVHKLELQGGWTCRLCGNGGFRSANEVKQHRLIFHE